MDILSDKLCVTLPSMPGWQLHTLLCLSLTSSVDLEEHELLVPEEE